MKPLNFAIIGCGRISKNHIQALKNNFKEAKLIAVCDIESEKAKLRAVEYEGLVSQTPDNGNKPFVYTNYMDMLDNVNIDAVSICTESGYHAKIALDCMKRGKHVMVEKPMALSVQDADKMVETAEKNHVKLCVCHQNRFNPPIQHLKQAIDEGRFGKLIAGNARILWNRNENYYKQAPWRGTYALDGGCLMNQCIHNIDLLQWLLGSQIEWVNGVMSNYIHPYIEAEDYGSIQIYFQNGAIGNVEGTVNIYPENLEESLTIIGENGVVCIGGLAVNKIKTWKFRDQKDSFDEVSRKCNSEIENVYGKGHTPLYKNFIESIKKNEKPYIDGKEGRIAMEIILAAYESNCRKHRVSFPVANLCSTDFYSKERV